MADTPEARQQLSAALLLHEQTRGGSSGSAARNRRSFQYRIVGGFAAQLERLGILDNMSRINLERCRTYFGLLDTGERPQHFDPLPEFLDSAEGPILFPRSTIVIVTSHPPIATESVPETPPPSVIESPGASSAAPSGPFLAPHEPPYPPERRALDSVSEREGSLPSGRLCPPEPPAPRLKGAAPDEAPGLDPYIPIRLRTSITRRTRSSGWRSVRALVLRRLALWTIQWPRLRTLIEPHRPWTLIEHRRYWTSFRQRAHRYWTPFRQLAHRLWIPRRHRAHRTGLDRRAASVLHRGQLCQDP